ncbi:uncharacterized protein L203_100812 [Cryptococcus depauperatus CBS 7841]|uniref:Uncharacterized protein n=1 Tax=Cryptococcus depauperatus CBS 7841 TaxID=1295531 RepID=A0A1E3J051_9TREE|nr:hypothetical protein L203_00602 [Cryptococcus depauperatus CBS 7841]
MLDSNTPTVSAIDHATSSQRHAHRQAANHPPFPLTPVPPLLSSILNTNDVVVNPAQPEFAELLTPLQLKKRRTKPRYNQEPTSIPPVAGPSKLGYYTLEGDLYRGAVRDPTLPFTQNYEDAISLGTRSTASSSSEWSWGSGNLDRARAVIGRVGEALGLRHGSISSEASSASDSENDCQPHTPGRCRRKKRSGSRLSKTISNLSRQTSLPIEHLKREIHPKKREFTLLLPVSSWPEQDISSQTFSLSLADERVSDSGFQRKMTVDGDNSFKFGEHKFSPSQVIVTPSLPRVLEKIRSIRPISSHTLFDTTLPTLSTKGGEVPVTRGGSAPGRTRQLNYGTSFANPPLPPHLSLPSRVYTLRSDSEMQFQPKSVSNFLNHSQNPSISTLGLTAHSTADSRCGTPNYRECDSSDGASYKANSRIMAEDDKGCWWLDVSCPTWEDLRDIGQLLSLHPLTLEDVLQQDPREKLDRFDKLGYYFLVIRALDEGYFKYTPDSSLPAKESDRSPSSSTASLDDLKMSEKALYGSTTQEELSEGKKEERRRGWGMGRQQGKDVGKMGGKVEIVEDRPGKEGLEGIGVGGVNVYLVVFADGLLSFHFEDISKHTHRVLSRILSSHLPSTNPIHSPVWIAHGLLDSIVDAFFPMIGYVDGAVDDIDSLTIDPMRNLKRATASSEVVRNDILSLHDERVLGMDNAALNKGEEDDEKGQANLTLRRLYRKYQKISSFIDRLLSFLPIPRCLPLPLKYLTLFFLPTSTAVRRKHEQAPKMVFDRSTMLRNITDMRKLVTGLGRLLSSKGAVVGQLRKRTKEEGKNVEAYIGDVEDHILLLQTSLHHYEYILSHCQTSYMSHLNVSFAFTRGRTDQAILALSTVTIGVLPMQFIISLFSTNVNVPHNTRQREPNDSVAPFNFFAGIVVGIFIVACCLVTIIRYWRWLARKKFAKLRGTELPGFWNEYWGWM